MGSLRAEITSGIDSELLLACSGDRQMRSGRSLWSVMFADDIGICRESGEQVKESEEVEVCSGET